MRPRSVNVRFRKRRTFATEPDYDRCAAKTDIIDLRSDLNYQPSSDLPHTQKTPLVRDPSAGSIGSIRALKTLPRNIAGIIFSLIGVSFRPSSSSPCRVISLGVYIACTLSADSRGSWVWVPCTHPGQRNGCWPKDSANTRSMQFARTGGRVQSGSPKA
jgi:hypothetical protein